VTSSWGGRRKVPKAFTEHGVLMLSSVLNSARAIQVNTVQPLRSVNDVLAMSFEQSALVEAHIS